ncbi:MAG: hypothetical protein WD063_01095 [Pirellulales bacterium]
MNRRIRFAGSANSKSANRAPLRPNHLRGSLETLESRVLLTAVTWTIDQSQSSTTVAIPDQPYEIDDAGTIYSGTLQIRNQSGGNSGPWNVGNSAQISGTLATDYTDESSIQFLLGQSNLTGVNSGSYIPDPANWNGTDFGGSTAPGPGVFGGRLYPTIDQVFGLPFTVGYFNFALVEYDLGSASLPISSGIFAANTTDIGISSAQANLKGVSIIIVGQILPDAQATLADLLTTNQAATGTITAPDPIGQPNLRRLTLPILQIFSIEITPGAPPFMGSLTGQIVATATIPASVTGRHLFYNESKYDNNTPGIDPADSSAIATDKSAYLPGGGLITPASVSPYSRGINGVMLDLTGPHGTLSLSDFEFSMSGQGAAVNNTPSTWVSAPAPTGFTVLADTPSVGTDRVEFIWANNAIQNRYLEVTVKGNDAAGGNNINTGLAASDIFYFGNRIGDDLLDPPAGLTLVTSAADEIDARSNPGFLQPLTNIYDYNKDSLVNAADQIIARGNGGFQFKINITNPPAAPGAAPSSDEGSGSAVASALAARPADASSTPPAPTRPIRRLDGASHRPAATPWPAAADKIVAGSRAENAQADSLAVDLALDDELLDSLLGGI